LNVKFAYLGHSSLSPVAGGQMLSLTPNLSREPVSFDAPLLQPLRFREAISALHDVVISDLRFKPRDKTAYEEWKRNSANVAACTGMRGRNIPAICLSTTMICGAC
jgi:hypothetical protein